MPPEGGTTNGAYVPSWSDLEPAVFQAIFNHENHKGLPLYVVVEKILGPDEPLPRQWPVAGTTGYDYLPGSTGCLSIGKDTALARSFGRFVGEAADFGKVVHESKVSVLRERHVERTAAVGAAAPTAFPNGTGGSATSR